MAIEIKIPRLGWSMEEGTFQSWLKKDGDSIKPGDPLFTLESEKAAQDIESTDAGVLRIPDDSPKPGEVVKVGHVIGLLSSADEIAGENPKAKPTNGDGNIHHDGTVKPTVTPPVPDNLVPLGQAPELNSVAESAAAVSPRARRKAVELGLDIRHVRGTGVGGRITEADILKAASTTQPSTPHNFTSMRRAIAKSTALSFSSTPHFYLRSEVNALALIEMREDLLPEMEKLQGIRLTLTDLILRAQGMALNDFPNARRIWAKEEIIELPANDVGIVVALPEGLMIPVVRSPEAGDLLAVAKQRSSLAAAARAGGLKLDALQGGATSLSNLGNSPADDFAAVISPGQSSMLAVGRAMPRPFVVDHKVCVRPTMKLCLSVDHRVMDGGPAAEFLGRIVHYLEHPVLLVKGR